jgi:hypothetical protein
MVKLMTFNGKEYLFCTNCGKVLECEQTVQSAERTEWSMRPYRIQPHDQPGRDWRLLPCEVQVKAAEVLAWLRAGNTPVHVELSEKHWRAILSRLEEACRLKGDDWIQWQKSVSETVGAAINKARPSDGLVLPAPPNLPSGVGQRYKVGDKVWYWFDAETCFVWNLGIVAAVTEHTGTFYYALYRGADTWIAVMEPYMVPDGDEPMDPLVLSESRVYGLPLDRTTELCNEAQKWVGDNRDLVDQCSRDFSLRAYSDKIWPNPEWHDDGRYEGDLADLELGQQLTRLEEGESTEDDLM